MSSILQIFYSNKLSAKVRQPIDKLLPKLSQHKTKTLSILELLNGLTHMYTSVPLRWSDSILRPAALRYPPVQ